MKRDTLKKTVKNNTRYYQKQQFKGVDQSIPFRLVGTHEYIHAVEKLGMLAHLSEPAQIEVYDEILNEQPEFSLGVDTATDERYEGQARRGQSGLAWMLALARIELGATVAMYGEVSRSFQFSAPRDFGSREYWTLLHKDASAHLQALETDPLLSKVSRSSTAPSSATLAYLRRLRIVDDMLASMMDADLEADGDTMNQYLQRVRSLRRKLTRKANSATVEAVSSSQSSESGLVEGRKRTTYEKGSVRAYTGITRACQAAFLNAYGARK